MANQNYLAQILRDNAPVGSVGAPGGVLNTTYNARPPIGLPALLGFGSFVPGIGDAMGLLSDAAMFYSDPKSRTKTNYALSALGLLPIVPSGLFALSKAGGSMNHLPDLAKMYPKQIGAIQMSPTKMPEVLDFADVDRTFKKPIFRSGDDLMGEHWAYSPDVALAYKYNPPFGGNKLLAADADGLEIIDGRKVLEEVFGDEDYLSRYQTDAWALESDEVVKWMRENGFDAVSYEDDFPSGASVLFAPGGIGGREISGVEDPEGIARAISTLSAGEGENVIDAARRWIDENYDIYWDEYGDLERADSGVLDTEWLADALTGKAEFKSRFGTHVSLRPKVGGK